MRQTLCEGRALFDERVDDIEQAVTAVVRAHRVGRDEAAELYGDVMVKVIDRDFAVLRRFGGRSRWSTYLFSVARRVLLDRRARRWGRWRPSASARRLGPAAVELDRRINRDGLEVAEAVAEVRCRRRARKDLEALAARIPRRSRRRAVPMDRALEHQAAPDRAGERVEASERCRAALDVGAVVKAGLRTLSAADRRLLALRFGQGWTVRRIAREQSRPERRLYARFTKILRGLRRHLEAEGIGWPQVATALEAGDALDGCMIDELPDFSSI
ncbi:MAG: hypothetical protein AAGM22_26905 [Acidobacteriota bacterium]